MAIIALCAFFSLFIGFYGSHVGNNAANVSRFYAFAFILGIALGVSISYGIITKENFEHFEHKEKKT